MKGEDRMPDVTRKSYNKSFEFRLRPQVLEEHEVRQEAQPEQASD